MEGALATRKKFRASALFFASARKGGYKNMLDHVSNVWLYCVNIYNRLPLISLKTSHSQVDSILQSCFGWANLHPDYLQEMTSLKRRLQ